jgi:hypothetical protein
LRIETRKRVQTNEAKSKRCRASPTKTTGCHDTCGFGSSSFEEERSLIVDLKRHTLSPGAGTGL